MSSIAAKWPPRSGVSGSNQRVPLEGDTGEAEGKWRPPQGADILGERRAAIMDGLNRPS